MKSFAIHGSFSELGSPVIEPAPSSERRTLYLRGGKRLLDIFLAVLILPTVLPVTMVLWLLTRLDGSAGFYGQERVGLNGRRFTCWKIRTMVPNAEQVLADLCARDPEIAMEWNQNQKLRNDPRITWIGRFMRKTSLDELPQLWNILKGDMSFVGPRPFTVGQEHLYLAAGGRAYFRVRPGITGPWQLKGRGATRFVDRVAFDEEYYREASLTQDLKMIVGTFGVVVKMTGH